MGGHDGLTHTQNLKANVFTFAITVEPKADNVRASGCETEILNGLKAGRHVGGGGACLGQMIDDARLGVGLGRHNTGAIAAAKV